MILQFHHHRFAEFVPFSGEIEIKAKILKFVPKNKLQISVEFGINRFCILRSDFASQHNFVERPSEVTVQIMAIEKRLPETHVYEKVCVSLSYTQIYRSSNKVASKSSWMFDVRQCRAIMYSDCM